MWNWLSVQAWVVLEKTDWESSWVMIQNYKGPAVIDEICAKEHRIDQY